MIYHASSAKLHLVAAVSNIMVYNVTFELRLRECYKAMCLEAISKDYWLQANVGRDSNGLLDK